MLYEVITEGRVVAGRERVDELDRRHLREQHPHCDAVEERHADVAFPVALDRRVAPRGALEFDRDRRPEPQPRPRRRAGGLQALVDVAGDARAVDGRIGTQVRMSYNFV